MIIDSHHSVIILVSIKLIFVRINKAFTAIMFMIEKYKLLVIFNFSDKIILYFLLIIDCCFNNEFSICRLST